MYLWIGLNDLFNEGQWQWEFDEAMTYTHWLPNQPDNRNNNENCVSLEYRYSQFGWNDFDCAKNNNNHVHTMHALCEEIEEGF